MIEIVTLTPAECEILTQLRTMHSHDQMTVVKESEGSPLAYKIEMRRMFFVQK